MNVNAEPRPSPTESHVPQQATPTVIERLDVLHPHSASAPAPLSLADLVHRLGGISLDRILASPPPGAATETDVLGRPNGDKLLCELVDGVLVRKPVGYYDHCWRARASNNCATSLMHIRSGSSPGRRLRCA